MRSVWKGSVAFGMVTIPVRLYTATQEHDIKFHQVHADDGGRIRYKRVCEVDGQEVPYDEIERAVEQDDGTVVRVSKEELDSLGVPTNHEIEVVQFVPAEQIDPVLFNKTYYVEPEGKGLKPYVLLREALHDTDRIAICRITLRQRESLAALRVHGDVILVQTMLWPDEVRPADFEVLDSDVELRRQEQAMAKSLVDSLTEDFDASAFTDRYAEAVADLVATKAQEGGAAPAPRAPEPDTGDSTVTDLVEALRASVERARAGRAAGAAPGAAGTAAAEPEPEPERPRRTRRKSEEAPAAEEAAAPRKRTTKKKAAAEPEPAAEPAEPARKRRRSA